MFQPNVACITGIFITRKNEFYTNAFFMNFSRANLTSNGEI